MHTFIVQETSSHVLILSSMVTTDRATNSLRNARYAITFYMLGQVVALFFRRYFIQELGDALLGLNTTLVSFLGFLNMAELGLATAIAFALYAPLAKGDQKAVQEIISIQAWFYRWVVLFILIGSGVLLLFFPRIFAESGIPMWYAYATYGVLLLNALWSYLFNYRQIIFSSDQREYKITFAAQFPKLIKQILQVFAILYLPQPYIWWLGLEALFGVLSALLIEWMIHRNYPWLKASASLGGRVRKEYSGILRHTGQVIYHKVGCFVLQQSTPLVLLFIFKAREALPIVTIYQNYLFLQAGIMGIFSSIFNGLTASVGNLILEGNHERVARLFRHLYALRLWLSVVAAFSLLYYSKAFMILWVGGERYFSQIDLILFVLCLLLQITRLPDQFLAAYGMFQDIAAPMVEATLNLGLSILLGLYFGITGVLLGIAISLLIVVHGWKPYFLYSRAFRTSVLPFFFQQAKALVLLLLPLYLFSYMPEWFRPERIGLVDLLLSGMSGTAIFAVVSALLLYLFHSDFREGLLMLLRKVKLVRTHS